MKEQKTDGRKVIWDAPYFKITMLEPTKIKDPCRNCWARGLCDDDECGQKNYPIYDT